MFRCSVNAGIVSLRRFIPLCPCYVCRAPDGPLKPF